MLDLREENQKIMKKLAAIGALGVLASGLFAQGTNTGGQQKNDWEEINFEFNSSILSNGYPSLLRLAELLSQHRDYKVRVTGHTDYVGSAAYNDKLAMRRVENDFGHHLPQKRLFKLRRFLENDANEARSDLLY